MKSLISAYITGFSNFAIQYNYQSASLALIVMSSSVCSSTDESLCKDGIQDAWVSGSTTALVLLGSMIGQLTMGYLGDVIGRNMAFLATVSIGFVFAVLQAVSYGTPESIYGQIIFFRFCLGIGLGGIYPLAATKAAEDESRIVSRNGNSHSHSHSNSDSNSNSNNSSNSSGGDTSASIKISFSYFWQVM